MLPQYDSLILFVVVRRLFVFRQFEQTKHIQSKTIKTCLAMLIISVFRPKNTFMCFYGKKRSLIIFSKTLLKVFKNI